MADNSKAAKRQALVGALRKAKGAVGALELAGQLGWSRREVYGLVLGTAGKASAGTHPRKRGTRTICNLSNQSLRT